jgi:LysM repeat protein
MYATGYGIRPLRAQRSARAWLAVARALVVLGVALVAIFALALVAQGGAPAASTTVVVQRGDTLWSIAAAHYPADDVRVRVEDIEHANSLSSPVIQVGQTLRLPG